MMLVQVRGVIYESVRAAATALGVSEAGVYGAVDRGKTDLLGLGHTQPKKIIISGIEFRSMSAASTALGMRRYAFGDIIKRGGKKRKAELEAAISQFTAKIKGELP